MARQLVPLKVKIGLHPNGHAKYPGFNSLASVMDSGMDWSRYVDVLGDGWHYDKCCGHKESEVDSPYGQQWGILLVPQVFATEAVAAFPSECQTISEIEYEAFHNERAHAHEEDEELDLDRLKSIEQKTRLGQALTEQQTNALDPKHEERGIRKNKRRLWADYKALKDIQIV